MSITELTLKNTLAKNLHHILEITGLTQNALAAKTEVSVGTLTNYLRTLKFVKQENGKTIYEYDKGKYTDQMRTPSVLFLMKVCALDELKKRGINLEISDLVSSGFHPIIDEAHIDSSDIKHQDFIGVYSCYFFDQTKSVSGSANSSVRELRFGVITVYDELDNLTQELSVRCLAKFFKSDERLAAETLKEDLLEKFDDSRKIINEGKDAANFDLALELEDRNDELRREYKKRSGYYTGDVSFSDIHAFLNLKSPVFNDNALIVLYAPQKRADHNYIGGIGTVSSITHGSSHMPVAQKIILSSNSLQCSDEEIAEHLFISENKVDLTAEANTLSVLCEKLYSNEEPLAFLDEDDKRTIIADRMARLIENYVKKNTNCISAVSADEDTKVYKFIRRFNPKE